MNEDHSPMKLLMQRLQHNESEVVRQALEEIGRSGRGNREAIKMLQEFLKGERRMPLRVLAVQTIAKVKEFLHFSLLKLEIVICSATRFVAQFKQTLFLIAQLFFGATNLVALHGRDRFQTCLYLDISSEERAATVYDKCFSPHTCTIRKAALLLEYFKKTKVLQ